MFGYLPSSLTQFGHENFEINFKSFEFQYTYIYKSIEFPQMVKSIKK